MIYLDHNATTPGLPEVFEAMRPYFCEEWGNPSSSYRFGSKLKGVLETARAQVADLLGANPREVLFTSCATESNNAALHAALMARPERRHIVTSQVEHSSVLSYCRAWERQGHQERGRPRRHAGWGAMRLPTGSSNVADLADCCLCARSLEGKGWRVLTSRVKE